MNTVPAQTETIQLLLDHEQNRRLLARELESSYTVVEQPPEDVADAAFDLCIVDRRAFRRHRDALAARKERAEPTFLPSLLLTDERSTDRLPGTARDVVDEVLATPISRAELTHRLENLLERRRLSVDLERRKERSDRRFEALFGTAPDPMVVTDTSGVVSAANGAFATAVDEPPEALVGTPVAALGFEPADTIERAFSRDSESAEPSIVRLDVGGPETRIMELNVGTVTTLDGADEHIGVFRDVTDREHREEELRTQNERLEEFASTIAHDLRNPLAIAGGYLDLARSTGEAEHFDAVERAHTRMEELIDEILTLARQGKLVMDAESVWLEAVATKAWQNVDTKGGTLTVENDHELLADESRLCEVFENLFRNAVQHSDMNDEPVHVRVGWIDGDEREGFYVEDDGPGIPEIDRGDVFEVGFTTDEGGTGFGLAILQQIIDAHGWEVSVVEGEDGGARFEIVWDT